MLGLRPYKKCDAEYIVKWIKDEVAFRKWCADRLKTYPITAEDLNDYYEQYAFSDSFFEDVYKRQDHSVLCAVVRHDHGGDHFHVQCSKSGHEKCFFHGSLRNPAVQSDKVRSDISPDISVI